MYTHGGDIYKYADITDFSSNVSPLGIPDRVKQAMRDAVDASSVYPDPYCRKLTRELSKAYDIPAGRVLCGAGACDLIYRLVLSQRPGKGVVFAPAFGEYEKALCMGGAEVKNVFPRSIDFEWDEKAPELIDEETDMVFFCNPQNPTGMLTGEAVIRALADKCRSVGALLVMDECFLDFVDPVSAFSAAALLDEYENLVVLKAYTKLFALAGVRLGFMLAGSSALCEAAGDVLCPWSVSVIAQAAGLACLSETEYVRKVREFVEKERSFLAEGLSPLAEKLYVGRAPFLFFKHREGLSDELIKHGILIRDCSDFAGLAPGCYRAAVKSREDNVRLIGAMQDLA